MRMGKRTLASVAAGALALGVVSFVGTTSADAATHKTPKAAYGGSVDAIRNGTVGNIPAAKGTIGMKNAPTTLQVVTAPTNSAKVYVGDEGGDTPAGGWDNATLLSRDDSILYASNYDDSTFGIAVDTAGSYTINMGNGTDTSTISFTTSGTPASLAWDPTSQTKTIGSLATMTLKVKDSAGSLTQAAVGDTIAVAASADDTPSDASVTAAEIYLGQVSITATAQSGTQSITATPQGTLPGLGVTAVSTSLTGSGTVSSTAVKSITVTTPSTAVNTTTAGAGGQSLTTTDVPVGSGNITISVEDTATASVGNVIQLAAKVSAGSITDGTSSGTAGAADDTIYTTVTTDSNKKATWSFTVSGSALNSGSTVTITQVNVVEANVSPMARDTITQTDPAVSVDTVTTSPDDSLLAAIGTVTPVTVTVKDQFGNAQSGWTVTAYRGAIGGTTLAVGTTNGSGQAVVNVTNVTGIVSGTTENYSFKAQYGSNVVNLGQTLSIAYTTGGGVTAIAVSSSSGTSPSTAVPALVTQPVLFVPDDTTGKAIGLSEAAVRQRVQKLTETGVMQVVAVTDPMQLGFDRQAMIGIKSNGDTRETAELLSKEKQNKKK